MLQSRFKMPSRDELKKRMDKIPDNLMNCLLYTSDAADE